MPTPESKTVKTTILPAQPGFSILAAHSALAVKSMVALPVVAWMIENAETRLAITVEAKFDLINESTVYRDMIAIESPTGEVYDPHRQKNYPSRNQWFAENFGGGKYDGELERIQS